MNILLIEPNVVLRKTYMTYLTRAGAKVSSCAEAQSAIHAIDEQIPDCIILELQLIGHSGIEFLYELRSYVEWQRIPVVVNTLVPRTEVPVPKELGISAYLYKPMTTLQQLARVVDMQLTHPA